MGCDSKDERKDVFDYKSLKDVENLEEKGRVQFFYHCPYSKLPIRDVVEKKKLEPHIEIGAENYWVGCYQSNNIEPFCKNDERYLFLMTTCQNKRLQRYYKEKFIVGYIDKRIVGKRSGKYFVKGDTSLFSFKDSIPLSELGYSKYTRLKIVDKDDTKDILERFKGKDNILSKCISEIKSLDEDDKTCLRKREDYDCPFTEGCLRWK